jgi:hypothetical protein
MTGYAASKQMVEALEVIKRFDISEQDLDIIHDLLNRDCDDDILDDVRDALDAVGRAIKTIRNRDYTPAQQQYNYEQEMSRE